MGTSYPLMVCEHCDAVYRQRHLSRAEVARCQRCNAVLDRHQMLGLDGQFALILAAGIVFLIANVSPIVIVSLGSSHEQSTLWGAVIAMWNDDSQIVAVIAAMTLFFFPLTQILVFGWLLAFARRGERAPGFRPAMVALHYVRPWSMIEVFMLGTLVAVVKASSYFTVVPGAGIWSYGVLTLLITVFASHDARKLWTKTAGATP